MRRSIQMMRYGESVVVRPTGSLDVALATELTDTVGKLPASCTVVLDFTALDECHDFALAGLLHDADKSLGARLSTRGVSASQANVLSLLGVPKRLIYGQLCAEHMTAVA